MRALRIRKIKGLDLQPGAEDRLGSAKEAKNLQISPAWAAERRPAFRDYCTLDAASRGLYVAGERMHSAVPWTGSALGDPAPLITYDHIEKQGGGAALAEVLSAEADSSGNAIVAIDSGVDHEMHYFDNPAGNVTTVATGFIPATGMVKLEQRLWVLGLTDGYLYGSGIDDFRAWDEDDAQNPSVFFKVSQHVSGGREAVQLAPWNGRLAIFYDDAVQLWRPSAAAAGTVLEQVVQGPGASWAHSVAQVGPDLVYAGDPGFRFLSNSLRTFEASEEDYGARVDPLVSGWDGTTRVAACYARARGQYLAADGNVIYCLSINRQRKMLEWTTWELPAGVSIDWMCELDGELFVRSGNLVLRAEDGIDQDLVGGTESDIPVAWEGNETDGGTPRSKALQSVYATLTDDAQLRLIVNGRTGQPATVRAAYPEPTRVFASGMGRTFAVRLTDATAAGDWRLEDVTVDLQVLGG